MNILLRFVANVDGLACELKKTIDFELQHSNYADYIVQSAIFDSGLTARQIYYLKLTVMLLLRVAIIGSRVCASP